MSDIPSRLPVIGYVVLQKGEAGFALPVLGHPTLPEQYFVQEVDELNNKVRVFRKLEYIDGHVIGLAAKTTSEIGQDYVHVFVSNATETHVGTARQLSGLLKEFTDRNRALSGLALQIHELVGTNEEKKFARANMQQRMLKTSGSQVAKAFYEGSILRSVLWHRMLESSKTESIARNVLQVRPALKAHIRTDGSLTLDLSALAEEDRITFDEGVLVQKILLEFATTPSSVTANSEEPRDEVHNFEEVQQRVNGLIRQITEMPRQEERLAILLDSILNDPTIGLTAAQQYADRAQSASWAVNEIRSKLARHYANRENAELFVADLIPRLFTHHYPLSRGELLYYLSFHLAKWPKVNEAIQQSLNRTASMFVGFWRDRIQTNLSAGTNQFRR